MSALVVVALGAGIGVGLVLVLAGWRGHSVVPSMRWLVPSARPEVGLAWIAAATAVGIGALAITGWPVAAVASAALVWTSPRLTSARNTRDEATTRTEAIASWAEMIRDNMAGSAGLEQALSASTRVGPAAIRPELTRFAARLDRMSLTEALVRLGEDLDHPSADLIVVSLVNATRMEARELGPLLGRLSEAIRGDVRMRLRVEVGRARIRTSARIVVATTAITMAFLFVFSRRLLEAYDSPTGQLWLVLVAGVFAAGGWLLRTYGAIDMPERFTARGSARGAVR